VNRLQNLFHDVLIKSELLLRVLQYIEILKFASKLTGLTLLNGRGKKTLDVSCGSGKGLLVLKLLGHDAYGFDINSELVSKVRSIVQKVIRYEYEVGHTI
jgi:ubiquinone/menaquinone biosynthesis C-methylase UbiE